MLEPDDYERKYMGGNAIVANVRNVSRLPLVISVIAGVSGLIGLVSAAMTGNAHPAQMALGAGFVLAAVLGYFLAGVLFTVQRATVTPDAIYAQRGLSTVRVPIAKITSCEYRPPHTEFPSPKNYYFLRRTKDGNVLVVEFDDEKGTHRKLVVGMDGADEIFRALEKIRGGGGVRVAVGADANVSDVVEESVASAAESSREGQV